MTLVVTALVAGASAGVRDAASMAISDGYTALRDAIRRRLGRDGAVATLDAAGSADPEAVKAVLAAQLAGPQVAADAGVVDAARRLLALTDPTGYGEGKYSVDLHEAKGVQVGDHNTQTNTFN